MTARRRPGVRLAVLSGHFFNRFFRNDVVDFEDQVKERLITILALLAAVFWWWSQSVLLRYQFTGEFALSWREKTYILALMMTCFGFAAVLLWDAFLPDRRDFVNLTPLPIRLRTIFLAKLASFLLLAGVFTAGMNFGAAPLFGMMLTPPDRGVAFVFRYTLAHLGAALAANLGILFALCFVQFAVLALLPAGAGRRVLAVVRFILLAGLVVVLLALLTEPGLINAAFRDLVTAKETEDLRLIRFPPFWFTGLYEVFLGSRDPLFTEGARRAGLVLAGAVIIFFAAAALSYRRHVRRTLETRRRGGEFERIRETVAKPLRAAFLRSAEERATYLFTASVLRSSGRHRSRMNLTLGFGAGLAAAFVMTYREGFRGLSPENVNVLGLPIFFISFVIMGWRRIAEIPADAEADWLFRATETPRRELYLRGAKKAFAARVLLPFWACVGAIHMALPRWTWVAAVMHAVFGFVVSAIVLEGAFFRIRKIPFTGTFLPGKLRLERRSIAIVLGGLLFLTAVENMERSVLRSAGLFPLFLAGAAAVWALFRYDERRFLRRTPFVFEERPEPALLMFPEDD